MSGSEQGVVGVGPSGRGRRVSERMPVGSDEGLCATVRSFVVTRAPFPKSVRTATFTVEVETLGVRPTDGFLMLAATSVQLVGWST